MSYKNVFLRYVLLPYLLLIFNLRMHFPHVTVLCSLGRDHSCLLCRVYFLSVCNEPCCPLNVICFQMELQQGSVEVIHKLQHSPLAVGQDSFGFLE